MVYSSVLCMPMYYLVHMYMKMGISKTINLRTISWEGNIKKASSA